MMKNAVGVALMVAAGLLFGGQAGVKASSAPPASVTCLDRRSGKPPLRYYGVALELKNVHAQARWYMIRDPGDVPLADKDVFSSTEVGVPFGGRAYRVGEKRAVVIRHYSPTGSDSFIAFRLPPHSQIKFDRYLIGAWKPIEVFEIWEVESIKVNGKTPLEKWLPYRTLSDRGVVVPDRTRWDNLDWDKKAFRARTDYPAEKVGSVRVKVLGKWKIPLKVKP